MVPPLQRTASALGVWLTLAALAPLVTGCESFFLPDAPPSESQLVVDGTFSPGGPWSIGLTRLRLLGEESPGPAPEGYTVDDAAVTVRTVGGGVVALEPVGGGRYVAPGGAGASPGRAYELVVEHPDLGRATASGAAPEHPSFEVSPAAYVDAGGNTLEPTARYRFRITVRGGEAGVGYALAVRQRRPAYEGETDSSVRLRSVPFTSDDPDLRAFYFDVGPVRTYTYFTEGAILRVPVPPGTSREIELVATATEYPESGDEFVVEVLALSPSLREYLYTLSLQDQYGQDPFVGAVPIASNVEGGLGVFDGFSRATRTVPIGGAP